ncbi:unnamed protein product [Dibothriocephalus latus]|uniref:EF-hand domain-containing protein n=1 Tax=Dibothriocephalus latus TaxID=60516 RepID=A0A3P7LEB4_DIBLA|nr:unnamed protein product [Dibothriocephalus latus]
MSCGRRSKSAGNSIFFAQKWNQLRLGTQVSTSNKHEQDEYPGLERKFRSASSDSLSAVKTFSFGADIRTKVMEQLEVEDLQCFQFALMELSQKQGGYVDLDAFRSIMKLHLKLPPAQMEMMVKKLFDEIDVDGLGRISCGDICTFLLSKHKAKEVQLAKVQLVQIKEPIKTFDFPNQEQIARTVAQKHGRGYIVAKTDGTLTFWSPDLKITKQRSLAFDGGTNRLTPKWYTDFLFLNDISKFVSSTGDRELEFYEMTTFAAYCRIVGLDTVPVCLTWGPPRCQRFFFYLFSPPSQQLLFFAVCSDKSWFLHALMHHPKWALQCTI